ncbi:bifunctional WD40 repeat/Chromatin assembly factor 1 subunit Cac2-CHAF1B-FAS2/WD40-YVTN repeat-like-containing domain superfamily/WD40-repeat-containing domain superfamily/Anaphase-promoting complex subunit 4 [Babesia duncani]|uniref:CAF1B/HIR1 beta-propeller domain-containing protein n=1 Tax=Babesia duncani TaxID=323732 RepID=A0AAD9PIH1_9APIC|nr:bifunctional WD40 repeat/Chromatin assembly factor 1 subunit Cac2-CHAF1B-FAS2/WD40-YVTN repeat-like-containing domain superfamily/WD40-repeat-containing domain superfamily/Anaphase-promoting complex subunit 4 [Babesia duncani]
MPRVFLPQILWHSKDNKHADRVYSIDFQPPPIAKESQNPTKLKTTTLRLATGGADEFVHIWQITIHEQAPQYTINKSSLNALNLQPCEQPFSVKVLARLVGHIGEVNAVRWNSHGTILATGGEDRCIFLWKKEETDQTLLESNKEYEEQWSRLSYYRLSNVVNTICWCPDGRLLAVATEDGHVSLVDTLVEGNGKIRYFEAHSSFAQGVSICPKNSLLASMGSDQSLRIWKRKGEKGWKNVLVLKSARDRPEPLKESEENIKESGLDDGRYTRSVFMSEELKTFFRRLDWSPDGRFLVAPAGIRYNIIQNTEEQQDQSIENKKEAEVPLQNIDTSNPVYTLYIFHRKLIHLGLPMITHISPTDAFVSVRFCPMDLSKLERQRINFFNTLMNGTKGGANPKPKTKASKKKRESAQLPTVGIKEFFDAPKPEQPEQLGEPEEAQDPQEPDEPQQPQAEQPEAHVEPTIKEIQDIVMDQQEEKGVNEEVPPGRMGKRIPKKPQFYHDIMQVSIRPRSTHVRKPKEKKLPEEQEYDTDIEEDVIIPRFLFAVGTIDGSLCFYDTKENSGPIAVLKNLHFCTITDVSWSHDGLVCASSSSDGYVTFVVFTRNEFY